MCKARAAAGSDARMSGCPLPVVICSGSGNQGLTVSMPIITAAEQLGKSQEELYRALAFGNLLTLYIKSGIGKLSAYCGVVSAGVAAVAFLKGDSQQIIEDTVSNGLANTSGIVCEGMKQTDVVILNEMLKH